jgi:hypothetical protein
MNFVQSITAADAMCDEFTSHHEPAKGVIGISRELSKRSGQFK